MSLNVYKSPIHPSSTHQPPKFIHQLVTYPSIRSSNHSSIHPPIFLNHPKSTHHLTTHRPITSLVTSEHTDDCSQDKRARVQFLTFPAIISKPPGHPSSCNPEHTAPTESPIFPLVISRHPVWFYTSRLPIFVQLCWWMCACVCLFACLSVCVTHFYETSRVKKDGDIVAKLDWNT